MKKSQKVTLGVLVIVVVLIYLMISGFSGNTGYELPLADIASGGEQLAGKYILTEGYLVQNSVEWNGDKIELKFVVKDEDGNQLPVVYNGVAPDNFTYKDAQIILKGSYDPELAAFKADKVETRCPGTYEAADAVEK